MRDETTPNSETSAVITDRAQGKAERLVLGKWPAGSILRIALIPVAFILIGGSIFFFMTG